MDLQDLGVDLELIPTKLVNRQGLIKLIIEKNDEVLQLQKDAGIEMVWAILEYFQ
jgi:hypothetical protein